MAILLLALVCRTWLPFMALGLLNRLIGRRIQSVFFCYAGSERYAAYYCYRRTGSILRWFPSIIGLFEQGGSWGLMCASPVVEAEFTDKDNALRLNRLLGRLERVRALVGASQLSLSGILPTFLARSSSVRRVAHTDHTSAIVRQAIHAIRRNQLHDRSHDLVLLGGAGRIGQKVHALLRRDGVESLAIDIAQGKAKSVLPCAAGRLLLVDVSRYGALNAYLDDIPPGSIVLNEVFPEPAPETVHKLRSRGIRVFHISGVEARVYPSLPHGYASAVPCCAICAPDHARVVLKTLA